MKKHTTQKKHTTRNRSWLGLAVAAALGMAALVGAAPQAQAQNYACLFYFSNYGDTLFYPGTNLSPTGDSWIMRDQSPWYSPGGGIPNFWGKPLWAATHGDGTIKNNYRFYFNGDPGQPNSDLLNWHADLITRAGIDFVVLDFTNGTADFGPNGPTYVSATEALCNAWQARLNAGLPIPQIVPFVHDANGLQAFQNLFYAKYDSRLFFNYQGKPMVLVADANDTGAGSAGEPAVPTAGIFANYTCRSCWALNTSAPYWQFKENATTPPPAFVYNGQPEQMCAAVSVGGTSDGTNLLPGSQGRQNGAFFKTYMAAAQAVRPRFTFVHSWNEWNAGNFGTQSAPEFIDQWLEQWSSDIEPEALSDPGSHGYQYYDLMAEQVGLLKGTFPVLSGHTYRIVNQNSGLNIDNPGGSSAAGQPMQQFQQNNASAQNWTFTDLNDGYWEITNGASGLALGVTNASLTDGAAIDQENFGGSNSQQWSLRPVSSGTWLLVNRASNLTLAVNGMSTANGGQITQWDDNGTADHNWRFEDTRGLFPGCYYTLTNKASGLNLDDPNGSGAVNTQIGLWTPNGATAQNWLLAPQGDGSYALTNQAGGLRLDDPNGSNTPAQHLQLWYANNASPQNWQFALQGDGTYTLTNATANLNLDDPNGAGPAGTAVQLWPGNGATAQEWNLTRQ